MKQENKYLLIDFGQNMKIVINKEELERHVVNILKKMPDNKILLDHFLENAIEAEADSIIDFSESNPFSESNY